MTFRGLLFTGMKIYRVKLTERRVRPKYLKYAVHLKGSSNGTSRAVRPSNAIYLSQVANAFLQAGALARSMPTFFPLTFTGPSRRRDRLMLHPPRAILGQRENIPALVRRGGSGGRTDTESSENNPFLHGQPNFVVALPAKLPRDGSTAAARRKSPLGRCKNTNLHVGVNCRARRPFSASGGGWIAIIPGAGWSAR